MAMTSALRIAAFVAGLAGSTTAVVAAPASAPASAPAAAPAATPAPETTTATYGDWMVVCATVGAVRRCEALTTARDDKNQPLAVLSLGYPAAKEPVRLALRVAVNATVADPAMLTVGADNYVLPFRICIPQGCVADKPLSDAAVLSRLRASAPDAVATLQWKDAAGQARSVRMSVKGLDAAFSQIAAGK